MTTLHVVPADDLPENHTLGDCRCRPRRRPIRLGDLIADWVHLHRSLTDEDELQPTAA
jgi:hypothetical protein